MIQAFITGALIGALLVGGAKLAAKDDTKDVYTFGDAAAVVETVDVPEA